MSILILIICVLLINVMYKHQGKQFALGMDVPGSVTDNVGQNTCKK